MPKVKVWNDNIHPYKEKFREQDIVIPSKGFIEMEYDDAVTFRGTFNGFIGKVDGGDPTLGYKMIRLEPDMLPIVAATDTLRCPSCNMKADTPKDLHAHLALHADDAIVDDAAEAEMRVKRGRPAQNKAG